MSKNKTNKKEDNQKPYDKAWANARAHHLLGAIVSDLYLRPVEPDLHGIKNVEFNKQSFLCMQVSHTSGTIFINKKKSLDESEWYFLFLTAAIILGFDLYKKLNTQNIKHEVSMILFGAYYIHDILGVQSMPQEWYKLFSLKNDISFKNEASVYDRINEDTALFEKVKNFNFLMSSSPSIIFSEKEIIHTYSFGQARKSFSQIFADNLISQAQKTILLRSNLNVSQEEIDKKNTMAYKARQWFVSHYPLLSALASSFEIVEDIKLCQRMDIEIGAVSALNKIIYINPQAQLNEDGMKFVIAHEILHVALDHANRLQGRDPLIWNLACDFVINHWLVEMRIGVPPDGIFLDRDLAYKSADEIYLMITHDIRLKRKMGTLKNIDAGYAEGRKNCDMLDTDPSYFSEFADACRHALLRGMFLHEGLKSGTLPANLVEEIKAINEPPIPWQVDLAQWIAQNFPLEESRRTYARPSRRQSSTPDIPRARYVRPEDEKNTRTFGVVIDSSGSMDRRLLAQCLGAVASYSAAQEVKFVRVIFCDAQPYDEGYVSVDILSQKMKVKGRGGTVLQPAINYLENVIDFPADAPILILSDGEFEDDLTIKREHAFLVPNRYCLPFKPRGKVFEFNK